MQQPDPVELVEPVTESEILPEESNNQDASKAEVVIDPSDQVIEDTLSDQLVE